MAKAITAMLANTGIFSMNGERRANRIMIATISPRPPTTAITMPTMDQFVLCVSISLRDAHVLVGWGAGALLISGHRHIRRCSTACSSLV